jgi:hypothetical protein
MMLAMPIGLVIYTVFGAMVAASLNSAGLLMFVMVGGGVLSFALWVWNVFDAYSEAEEINKRHRHRYGRS